MFLYLRICHHTLCTERRHHHTHLAGPRVANAGHTGGSGAGNQARRRRPGQAGGQPQRRLRGVGGGGPPAKRELVRSTLANPLDI